MNMYPSQVSPPRTPGCNEYVPLVGVPSKNTGLRCGGEGDGVAAMGWCGISGGDEMVMMAVGDGGGFGGVLIRRWWRLRSGDEGESVAARVIVDSVDRVIRILFGFGRKACQKSFSAAVVVAGGGRLVVENNGEKSMYLKMEMKVPVSSCLKDS
nr:hypothetical protein [Tanacetum cinerariifolium]